MKKLTFKIALGLVLASFSIFSQAQTADQKARVEEVRKQYQEAARWTEESRMTKETNNSMNISFQRMTGENGIQKKDYEFYYDVDKNAKDGMGWKLYFVRVRYNIASESYREEYLFNEDTQNMTYAFYQIEDKELKENEKEEIRCYYYNDGKFCQALGLISKPNGKTSTPSKLKDITAESEYVKAAMKKGENVKAIFELSVNNK